MPPADTYQPFEAFLVAEAYCYAGRILVSQFPEPIPQDMTYVIAANLALGLELYLKCLILLDGKNPKRKHNLKSLFDELSPKSKDAIQKNHRELLKTDPSIRAESAKLRLRGENPERVFDFHSSLQKSANAFEQSRYPFDPSYEAHTYLAVPIEKATRRVIIDRNPGWKDSFAFHLSRPDTPPTSPAH